MAIKQDRTPLSTELSPVETE
ncbi:MAG: hypothetical protein QOD95_2605, partial [Gammaproteobacteria bacterium]|nr:hypothetical protein [Gammaproteobacteria bacterium]